MTDALTSFAIGSIAARAGARETGQLTQQMTDDLLHRLIPGTTVDVEVLIRETVALRTDNASLLNENSVLRQDVARLLEKIEEWRRHSDQLKGDVAELRSYADWAAAELGKRQGG